MPRLSKYVVITTKDQAQRLAKSLRTHGCKNVTYRKTSDKKSPYHLYGQKSRRRK